MKAKLEDTQGCWNFLLRRTSRVLARHYDDALRPFGLRSTQFNVLAVLAQRGPVSLSELAEVLALERSATARNLKPLERLHYVTVTPGKDKRMRIAEITTRGRKTLMKALPAWGIAQDKITAAFATNEADRIVKAVRKVGQSLENEN